MKNKRKTFQILIFPFWLLHRITDDPYRISVVGDLEELYKDVTHERGTLGASFWLWGQIIRSVPLFVLHFVTWRLIMFKSFLKIAMRNIYKYKGFSLINIGGLAVAITCVIFILLWIQDELNFDSFHKNVDNIHLVIRGDAEYRMAVTSTLLASALMEELPEVISATNYSQLPASEKVFLQYGEKIFEEDLALTDSIFFKIFSFPFKEGNYATAFPNSNSIVISEKIARKYFGNENVLGKSMYMCLFSQKVAMTVTGVLEHIPQNSHLQQNIFIPLSIFRSFGLNSEQWDNQVARTYILTEKHCDKSLLSEKITACEKKHQPDEDLTGLQYSLLSLKRIHLHGQGIQFLYTTGDIKYVYIFLAIAFIILIIACVNYMNFSTALSLKRSTEIGIKKVVGANRKTLIGQIITETLVISAFAAILAVILVQFFTPLFNQMSGKALVFQAFNPRYLIGVISISLLSGLLAGCYPAFFISAFQPLKILMGQLNIKGKKYNVRRGLVVFQFFLSIVMIICTAIVYDQLRFIRDSNLGYDKENLICVQMRGEINNKYEVFKNELIQSPHILGLTRSEPLSINSMTRTTSIYWQGKREDEEVYVRVLRADYDFASTYNIDLLEGRYYSKQFLTDQNAAYVINKTASKLMNFASPLAEEINLWGEKGKIIGVLNDFHFSSFHTAVEPLIVIIPGQQLENVYYRLITIRIIPETLQESVQFISEKWSELIPEIPLDYYFIDDTFDLHYRSEQRMGSIFKYFTVLSILIACLGLFGLISFIADNKLKEVSIRKVLGASIGKIIILLGKEFTKWVLLANLFAWPIAYLAMRRWLENFAYRTNIDFRIFIFSAIVVLVITLVTISYHVIKAARTNPVDNLKYE